jgi:hypothetical protein
MELITRILLQKWICNRAKVQTTQIAKSSLSTMSLKLLLVMLFRFIGVEVAPNLRLSLFPLALLLSAQRFRRLF